VASGSGTTVVERAKELLADETRRIELDAFINEHLRTALEALSPDRFPITGAAPQEDFVKRAGDYEAALSDLLAIVILLARWGEDEGLLQLEKIIARIAETAPESGGTVLWLRLRWYPLLLLMYGAGIAAIAARHFKALHVVLATPVAEDPGQASSALKPLVVQVLSRLSDVDDNFRSLPGRDRVRYPRSEHLFGLLQPLLQELLFLGNGYERLFDRFEVLATLVFADFRKRPDDVDVWGPPGRFAYKFDYRNNPFAMLISEAEAAGPAWPLLSSGLFGGAWDRFQKVVEGYKKTISR
jgi:hypothetical protein